MHGVNIGWEAITVMDARDYVQEQAAGFFGDLKQWLAIPSISADPGHHGDVRASAEWLAAHLRTTGFPQVEIWETGTVDAPGLPAVFACWPAADPAAPTVCVYGHHDVQPVDPVSEWDFPPFEPTQIGDVLLGRGASDDKGQVLLHALGLRACLVASGASAPPVTIKMLIEGEEESGSPHFAQLLTDRAGQLACDVVVVSDTTMWAADVPSLCTGMRGLTAAEITLLGPDTDLHSGSFGGGVPNPLHAMTALLAGLHDSDGRVTVPGFYDNVVNLTPRERELFARLPFDEKVWLADAGHSQATAGESGYTTLERIWARPTAEINGMWGGYTGPGKKTIVPREAHAKVSFRLVADQDPAQVVAGLSEYVAAHTPPGIEAVVTSEGPGVRPSSAPLDSPAVQAGKRAVERAFGTEALFTREGGSGPEEALGRVLDAPVLFLGVGLPGDRIHAPNERMVMDQFWKGLLAAGELLLELGGR